MRTAWWTLWLLLVALSACSKSKDRVLRMRFGMSYQDIARQDPDLADDIEDAIKQGFLIHDHTYSRFEILHPRKDEVMLVFHDREVRLETLADWTMGVEVTPRSGVTIEEVRTLKRAFQTAGLDCQQAYGSTAPMERLEGVDPCTTTPVSDAMKFRVAVVCTTPFEGATLRLDFQTGCWPGATDAEPPRLFYDFSFSFLGDRFEWLKPRYEPKYGRLPEMPKRVTPQEYMEMHTKPSGDGLREGTR